MSPERACTASDRRRSSCTKRWTWIRIPLSHAGLMGRGGRCGSERGLRSGRGPIRAVRGVRHDGLGRSDGFCTGRGRVRQKRRCGQKSGRRRAGRRIAARHRASGVAVFTRAGGGCNHACCASHDRRRADRVHAGRMGSVYAFLCGGMVRMHRVTRRVHRRMRHSQARRRSRREQPHQASKQRNKSTKVHPPANSEIRKRRQTTRRVYRE